MISLRQGICFLVVVVVLSNNLLGSDQDQETILQVRWSELKKLIVGKKATLQLAEGARVEGRISMVKAASLVVRVRESSNLKDYPKGEIQIPRESISRIEVRGLKENKGKRIAATVGTFVGTMMGSMVAIAGTEAGEPGDKYYGSYAASIAIATGVALLVNRALRPKDLTFIKILPDATGETVPKPTNSDRSSDTTASGEAISFSLVEDSSSDRFRRQARRALMRQGLPLALQTASKDP